MLVFYIIKTLMLKNYIAYVHNYAWKKDLEDQYGKNNC